MSEGQFTAVCVAGFAVCLAMIAVSPSRDVTRITRAYHQCAGTLTVQGGPDDRLRLVCTLDGGQIGFMEPLE